MPLHQRGEWKRECHKNHNYRANGGELVRDYAPSAYAWVDSQVVIESLKRENASVNGNPAWSIKVTSAISGDTWTGWTYRTQTDSSAGYAIDYGMVGKTVNLYLTRAMRVVGFDIIEH